MFTLKQLNKIMPEASKNNRIVLYYDFLLKFMEQYEINNLERMACFLATIAVESGELKYTKEIWGPTASQSKYEGRTDLGNTQPGDGYKFLGRGLIQLTGRYNYKKTGDALGVDLIKFPELLQEPEAATSSACWWWKNNGCNGLADGQEPILRTSKMVNTGNPNSKVTPNHLAEREKYYFNAKQVLSIPDFGNVVSGIN